MQSYSRKDSLGPSWPPVSRLPLILAGLVCLGYLASELYVFSGPAFPLDDSWIHLRFAHQLAQGEGLAYNPEQWISGSTAPLWTAFLALGFLLPGGPLFWAKAFGCLFFLAAVWCTDRIAAFLEMDDRLRTLAGVLVASTHWLVWSALSGMEIHLFTFLSLFGIWLHLREQCSPTKVPLSLVIFAAACLARPEGYLLFLAALADNILHKAFTGFRDQPSDNTQNETLGLQQSVTALKTVAMPLARVLPAIALIVLPTWIFYYQVGSSLLPTTFAVKASPMADLIPSSPYLRAVLDVLFRSQPWMLLFAGAGVLRLWERVGKHRSPGLLLFFWPAGLAFCYSLLAANEGPVVVGNFGRYYFPILPVIVLLGMYGISQTRLFSQDSTLQQGLRALLFTLLLAPQAWGILQGPPRYLQTVGNVEDSDVKAARWLAERVPAEALLASQDIGALKYFLPNPVLDLTGIVNPEMIPLLKASDSGVYWEERLLKYLETKKPDFLIVFPRSYPMLTSRTPGFAPVQKFPIPNNVTMAGNELVIFATPWNRFPVKSGS